MVATTSETSAGAQQLRLIFIFRGFGDPLRWKSMILDKIWWKSMILVFRRLEKSQNRRCWGVPSTPKPKIYAGNEVLTIFFFAEKKLIFLRKIFFRNIFRFFRRLKIANFRIWQIPDVFVPI